MFVSTRLPEALTAPASVQKQKTRLWKERQQLPSRFDCTNLSLHSFMWDKTRHLDSVSKNARGRDIEIVHVGHLLYSFTRNQTRRFDSVFKNTTGGDSERWTIHGSGKKDNDRSQDSNPQCL